jgi:GNAT superfamily N-acetyltransferase
LPASHALADDLSPSPMSDVRPLESADIPAVADLFRVAMGPDNLLSRPWLAEFLRETLLESPWADPEIPSLVATDDGAITGFIGSNVRPVVVDGKRLRGACCAHLVVAEGARSRAIGPQLLGRYMGGPQDLTFTDTATDVVARMWRTFGGRADPGRTTGWMLVLRPAQWLAAVGRARVQGHRAPALAAVPALPFHVAGARITGHTAPESGPQVDTEPLTAAGLVEHKAAVLKGVRAHLDYDEAYVSWLFGRLDSLYATSVVVRRLVRVGGKPVGWFVYVHDRGGPARVLQVAARERDTDLVVEALVADARERGVTVLSGRLEPGIAESLRKRWAILGFDARTLVHARDLQVLEAVSTGPALLTRLDGEWW